ncbi:hypothetical protein PPERSA_11799 [Pseudocohnilembus persalinus]|uniref:Nucleophile aminohydrolase n=1 Tax=Pseudocohnilembus persalinus TaxID=266149 RepID=A0A0V0QRJ4_PSEPJ|nr:hypothetical protein PPERSA_11799 [Pseudocohnilembus persalinus]|eukprot:KRX04743.1 hypothetical protein PPERSA_11799 [Pseudocohnilembus persalinus]
MASQFDKKTNCFDRDGRLQQLENAQKAIETMGASVSVLTKEGIVLTCVRQDYSFLLEQTKDSDKIYKLDDHIYVVTGGILADANYLIDRARVACARYRYQFQSEIPVEQLTVEICDIKQQYTHFGGKRPFGASFIVAGFDRHHQYQIYSTEPSGFYFGWRAQARGRQHETANSLLKQEYKEDINLQDGLNLAVKALVKTLDTTNPEAKKIEVQVISKNDKGQIQGRSLPDKEIEQILKNIGFEGHGQQ